MAGIAPPLADVVTHIQTLPLPQPGGGAGEGGD